MVISPAALVIREISRAVNIRSIPLGRFAEYIGYKDGRLIRKEALMPLSDTVVRSVIPQDVSAEGRLRCVGCDVCRRDRCCGLDVSVSVIYSDDRP